MTPPNLRRLAAAAALLTLFLAFPTQAAKRRAVAHRPRPVSVTATITGTVLDAVTNAPVISATAQIDTRSGATNAQGRFEVKNVTAAGSFVLRVERSGYVPATLTIGPNDSRDVTVRLTPTTTVTVRRTSGETIRIDTESFRFGYAVPFSTVLSAEFENFCTTDGTKVVYQNTELKRVVGPATVIAGSPCCPTGVATRMNVTLRTGASADLVFTDACDNRNQVELIGRNHVTGAFESILITEVAEIVFP